MPDLLIHTLVEAPVEVCFDLARSVEAHIASTKGSDERVVAGVKAGLLDLGDEVVWAANHLGFRWKLKAKITDFDRPCRFVDEQVAGPFAEWWHEHLFEPSGHYTTMIDHVRYRLPVGLIGKFVDGAYVNRYLTNLLEQRALVLKAMAERGMSGGDQHPPP